MMHRGLGTLLRYRGLRQRFGWNGRIQLLLWLVSWLLAAWLVQTTLDWLGFSTFAGNNQRGYEIATLGYMFLLQIWAIASGAQLLESDLAAGRLDWLVVKPISKLSLTLATYISEIVWLGALTLGVGIISYLAATLAGFAAMNFNQAIIVLIVAWISVSFWSILTATLATILDSTRISVFVSFALLIATGATQNFAQIIGWVGLSPTLLVTKLEPLMLGSTSLAAQVPSLVVVLIVLTLCLTVSSLALRRHYTRSR